MKAVFKLLAVIFIGLFGYATQVQFNDPDPFFWSSVYIAGVIVSFLFLIDKIGYVLPLVLGLFYIGMTIGFWPDEYEGVAVNEGMKSYNIERGREAMGALIAAGFMFVFAFRLLYLKNKSKV